MSRKKYRSDIAKTVHKTISLMHSNGTVSSKTMREIDHSCLTKAPDLTPREIRAIRKQAGVSQSIFAEHIGVTVGLVSKWECGDKHPSRMALKLLAVVKAKGLDVIA
jgi:putative transcriptional regulator